MINALLAVSLVIVGGISWRALSSQNYAMSELALISKAARYHQDAETKQAELRAVVNAALAGRARTDAERQDLIESLEDSSKDLRRDLVTLEKLDLPDDLVDTETKVQTLADTFLSRASEIARLAVYDPNSVTLLMGPFNESLDNLTSAMLRQTAAFSTHIVKANYDADAAVTAAKRWLLTAALFVALVAGVLVEWISISIRGSLRRVRDVAQALANGDRTARCPADGKDEIGALGRAINGMAESLNDLINRLMSEADRDAFGTQLVEALEMADTETEVYDVLARAMGNVSREMPMELLVADSSRAHLEHAVSHPMTGSPGCNVESPFSCMAVRRGATVTTPDSEALNSCTRLRGRSCGAVSAVCVPISFMGRALGVLHATGPVNHLPDTRQITQLTTLGQQAGGRIGTVRAFHSTQQQAATDSLTGLANRRTAEEFARGLGSQEKVYSVVLADLDHFKKLNDSRGHEAGDQALRLFAETLRGSLRDHDLPARWGGEEFVLLLPGATAKQALEAVERLRAALAEALLVGGTPVFTCSFGIADSSMAQRLDELLKIADEALYRAKESGRDRAVIGGKAAEGTPAPARREYEHPAAPDIQKLASSG